MKTLTLVRHAKSSWKDTRLPDFDRPLNKRGKRDAPAMAAKLADRELPAGLIWSSPALRAQRTAEALADALGIDPATIQWDQQLYAATAPELHRMLLYLDDALSTVVLIGHNPAITDVATQFAGDFTDNVPTSGQVCIDFAINRWTDICSPKAALRFFDYPKRHPELQSKPG